MLHASTNSYEIKKMEGILVNPTVIKPSDTCGERCLFKFKLPGHNPGLSRNIHKAETEAKTIENHCLKNKSLTLALNAFLYHSSPPAQV